MRIKALNSSEAIITNEKRLSDNLKKRGIDKPIYVFPWISNQTIPNLKNRKNKRISYPDKFNLLNIGIIRKGKNVHFLYDVLKNLDYNLTIAGNPKGKYGKRIQDMAERNPHHNINFVLGYLEKNKYNELIQNCSFLILAHEEQGGMHSSGPMIDAFLNGRPIIAPNNYPFNYYVKKYNVGLLYEEGNQKSLKNSIQRAKARGPKSFRKNIENLLNEKFDYDKLTEKMEGMCKKHFDL